MTTAGEKKYSELTIEQCAFGVPLEISDYKSIPDLYCLCEWTLDFKKIRIYHKFYTENNERARGIIIDEYFTVEIYNDDILNKIMDNFKYNLKENSQKRNTIKKEAAAQF